MKLADSIVRAIAGTAWSTIAAEGVSPLAGLGGVDPGPGFRRLTEQPDRDLPTMARDREIELAYFLYKTNILAGRMLDLKRDFVVGDGFSITSPDPAVQTAIDEFYTDPVNQLDERFDQLVLELGMYGEQAYPAFTTPHMGRVRLGYLDPAQIDAIYPDPENAALLVGLETKGVGGKRRRYPIVMPLEALTVLSPAAQRLRLSFTDVPIFFFSVNRVTNATRGSSDLLRSLDWLDQYESWMFDRMETSRWLGVFVWDVVLKGADERSIREWLTKNPPPKPNSIRAHNEQVEWNAVAPDMKSYEVGEAQGNFKRHILSTDGWPDHWFGGAQDVNRATAAEMGDPIVKSLTQRQKKCMAMSRALIRYNLRQRVQAGSLARTVTIERAGQPVTVAPWDAFTISAPEIASRDLTRLGSVIVQVTQALMVAQQQHWIGHDDAAATFALIGGMFGREMTPAAAPPEPEGGPGSQDYTPEMLAWIQGQMTGAAGDGTRQAPGGGGGGGV